MYFIYNIINYIAVGRAVVVCKLMFEYLIVWKTHRVDSVICNKITYPLVYINFN